MPVSHEEMNVILQAISKKKNGAIIRESFLIKKCKGQRVEIGTKDEVTGVTSKITHVMDRKSIYDTIEIMEEAGFLTKVKKGQWKKNDFNQVLGGKIGAGAENPGERPVEENGRGTD